MGAPDWFISRGQQCKKLSVYTSEHKKSILNTHRNGGHRVMSDVLIVENRMAQAATVSGLLLLN